jgi:hypothetical protein
MSQHSGGGDHLVRVFNREVFNNRLAEHAAEDDVTETAFACECVDVACQTYLTISLAEFWAARGAEQPIIADGHRTV